ncbi:MAG: hypothetical protein IKC82_02545 [Lentisphaeria bacterium]|nr:hypothetical protein [Lentisphaeria bacterium]MBR7130856.1 hypothetical protein [Lentisphaeria bacterium]
MKRRSLLFALLIAAVCGGVAATAGQPEGIREVKVVQVNGNPRMVSRLFPLKHQTAQDLFPFVESAILRYNANSRLKSVNCTGGRGIAFLVTTGEEFMPYVADLLNKLDIPGKNPAKPAKIEGSGMVRIAYNPQYRAAAQFKEIIDVIIASSEGNSGIDLATNTIFWRDTAPAAMDTLDWVKKVDRPLPQARIRFNYYEVRESTLRDVGFDYLAWKNGPGVNLFNVGYNAGRLVMSEAMLSALSSVSSWGYGGLFFAPSFDMSFIRCLQQSGEASVAADGVLTVVNTPIKSIAEFRELIRAQQADPANARYQYKLTMMPEYQNIAKNSLGRSFIGASFDTDETGELYKNPPVLELTVTNPIICVPGDRAKADASGFMPFPEANTKDVENGGVIFRYNFNFKNVVERGNTGQELANMAKISGGMTLGYNVEKVVGVYEKSSEVRQTIGLPVLSKIPVLKYLFSTTTVVYETTYIIITAEATPVTPDMKGSVSNSRSAEIHERQQKDFFED